MSRLDAWSRRKAAVEAEAEAEAAALVTRERNAEKAALEARDEEELLGELGLAAPEALESPDAVREFLTHDLPEYLKTRALRRLWRMNPTLANLDGLLEYGEDYTDSATVVENLQTAYQVGKGMLKHVEELARQAAAKAEAETDTDEETGEDVLAEDGADDAPAPATDPEVDRAPAEDAALSVAPEAQDRPDTASFAEDDPAPATRRRMVFTFTNAEAGGAA